MIFQNFKYLNIIENIFFKSYLKYKYIEYNSYLKELITFIILFFQLHSKSISIIIFYLRSINEISNYNILMKFNH